MDTSSAYTSGAETSPRKLRTFLSGLMDALGETDIPAISLRVRRTRERQQQEWDSQHEGERGNPYTQEQVARRVGITLGAYGKIERGQTEPKSLRLRQIARALDLDEDYFSPSGDLASATARVEAEADRLKGIGDELERFLEAFRALLGDEPLAPPPDEHA